MKRKFAAVAIASAAVLGLGSMAYAGTTLENIGTVDFADSWIDGTNLLEKQDSSGNYGIADMNGNLLTSNSYARVGYDSGYGLITVTVNPEDGINGTGVVTMSGQEIVPCSYGEIDIENEHWIEAIVLKAATADQYDYESWFNDNYYLIDHVDFYYVDDDGAASMAGSLTRDLYKDCRAYGRYINIESRADGSVTAYDGTWTPVETPEPLKYLYDDAPGASDEIVSYYENGQYGLKDAQGNVIIGPTYGYISTFEGDYVEVTNDLESGEVSGLIDKTGAVVVPVEYEDIDKAYYAPATAQNGYSSYAYNNYGYFAVVKDNKLGYVDEAGNVTCDFTIAKDNCDNYGASATYTDMGGALHLLAADGTDTDISQYNSVYPLDGGSGMYYKVTDADYNTGVIDWHGNVIAEVKYNNVDLSGDGQYLLLQAEYGAPCELVKLTYTPDAAAPAAAETEADAAAPAAEAPVAEAPAAEAPAAEADLSSVAALIDSAITLAGSDAAGNKDAIISVLNKAAEAVAQSRPEIKTVIDSAIGLMGSDTIDGTAVASVLNGAKALIG